MLQDMKMARIKGFQVQLKPERPRFDLEAYMYIVLLLSSTKNSLAATFTLNSQCKSVTCWLPVTMRIMPSN
jgi:heme/copper-type cytochrome/quinol oxidase subunit 3